ncbi:MAG: radical SAM protein, partial [Candidatus Aminicenantes bacterium]|nr:radical SAM protein [Candidatus Aminicenantes bacterium]
MSVKKNETYILNPGYRLKKDKKRVILFNRDTDETTSPVKDDFLGNVHPVYAILFSFFDGQNTLADVLKKSAALLSMDQEVVLKILSPLIENKDDLHTDYDSHHFHFPENLLIKKQENHKVEKYNIEDFFIPKTELDLESWRLYSPIDILLMINTRCVTDCVYCYAQRDKNINLELPFERMKELIREAKNLSMRSFDMTGGEYFLYPKWEELLVELLSNGFIPYISTKSPLSMDTIKKLKNTGLNKIQISLDSIIEDELIKILNVGKNYHKEILDTLHNLDKEGFNIYINSQMNSFNSNSDNIFKMIDHLLNLKNLKRLNVGAAGVSIYRSQDEFLKYRPSLENAKKIEKHIVKLKEDFGEKISLNFSGYSEKKDYIDCSIEEREENFKKRARCSANFYALVVLPDGKVTICEAAILFLKN